MTGAAGNSWNERRVERAELGARRDRGGIYGHSLMSGVGGRLGAGGKKYEGGEKSKAREHGAKLIIFERFGAARLHIAAAVSSAPCVISWISFAIGSMKMESGSAFVSASDRAQRAVAFLYLMMVFDLLSGGLSAMRLINAQGAEPGLVENIVSILYFVVLVLLIVFFSQWMHRAYKNLSALGATRLRFTPGWAVGNFFIPFINLVYPLYAMREIWHISNPNDRYHRSRPDRWPVPLIGTWWAFYIVMNLLSNFSFRMTFMEENPAKVIAGEWLGIAGNVLSIPAALLAMAVIRRIDEFQTEKAKQPPAEKT